MAFLKICSTRVLSSGVINWREDDFITSPASFSHLFLPNAKTISGSYLRARATVMQAIPWVMGVMGKWRQ